VSWRLPGQQTSVSALLVVAMVLLRTAPGVSRIHASRRVFDILKKHDLQVPVIHHQWCGPAAGCTHLRLLPSDITSGQSMLGRRDWSFAHSCKVHQTPLDAEVQGSTCWCVAGSRARPRRTRW
jgi:hypothetical protein